MLHTKFHNSRCIPLSPFPRNGQNMALLWPKHGPHVVLKIGSIWILIVMPRDIPCQISYCWVYISCSPLSSKLQKYGPFWPKQGSHMVLQIGSSLILINVPRDAPCQISHCWVCPVDPFPRNCQNMALLWPKHGPHMVLLIGSSWILINVPRDAPCQISKF